MYRKYIDYLVQWVNSKNRKPLIVWGARQVGKSYLIKDLFAEEYFKNKYIYVDCRIEREFVEYCENHLNVKEIIKYLSLDKGIVIDKSTLIIFDEVQECLPIITLMKYFCQDFNEIPVIVTGSMVRMKIHRENKKRGNSINRGFLFPVGKINQLTVYPMNFEEYIYNANNMLYKEIKKSYVDKKVLDNEIHNKILNYFYDYLLIGGMPEVVKEYLESDSYFQAKNILTDLYDNYLDDMELYQASPESIVRSKKVFENIFKELNKETKNFSPSLIEKNARNREFVSSIDWLSFSFIVYKSSLIKEHVTTPLIESNESLYRLYLSDMGMFSYQSKVNPKTFISNSGRNTLSGIFFENYVATELVRSGYKLFYWKGKENAEFEFLIESEENVIPIDVKKTRGSMNSLDKYTQFNKITYALKVSTNQFGYNDEKKIMTIPFYYLPFYLDELKEKENI